MIAHQSLTCRTFKIWGLLAFSIAFASPTAQAQENQDCWASKRRTDLKTGKIHSECVKEPESSLNYSRLRQISELGAAGQKEAPYVLERLKDEDWDIRAEAARTLGLIGYADAIPQLVAAITPQDWRSTLEAMVSLTELKAPQADAVLKDIASSYWLPSIAEVARDLAAGRPSAVNRDGTSFRLPMESCNASADPVLIPKCPVSSDEPDSNRYDTEKAAYQRSFWQKFRNHPNLKGARRITLTVELPDGKLIGTNHGEWGGELGFVNEKTVQTILDDNILAVTKQGDRIIAVTGFVGGMNRIYIWEVLRSTNGEWSARRLWRLPGDPYDIVMTPDGAMGIFGQFGSVLYKPDNTLQWLACGPYEWCRR